MSDQTFRIIIVGGGIAGLATAIALRAENRDILILEKSKMLREVGALISLQPNATKIVSSWNIDEYLKKSEPTVDKAFKIFNTEGRQVANIPMNPSYGADRIIYHRQDLHSALKEAATSKTLPGQPARIRTSAAVLRTDPAKTAVILENDEILEADLIVAADGIRSSVRESVLGEAVDSVPTGLSAYRLLIEADKLKDISMPAEILDPKQCNTTMIIGHDKRVIMGPGRGNKLFGIVALVPDEKLNEVSHGDNWTATGSLEKLLESYKDFPECLQDIFKTAPEIALWQMRDIPPLEKWVNGQTILIGDAAHAMLPTQGQGASQSIEDAEALGSFFAGVKGRPSKELVHEKLMDVFNARHKRASIIQAYSRQQARPGTEKGSNVVTLKPEEFMDYNCLYSGAKSWLLDQKMASLSVSKA